MRSTALTALVTALMGLGPAAALPSGPTDLESRSDLDARQSGPYIIVQGYSDPYCDTVSYTSGPIYTLTCFGPPASTSFSWTGYDGWGGYVGFENSDSGCTQSGDQWPAGQCVPGGDYNFIQTGTS